MDQISASSKEEGMYQDKKLKEFNAEKYKNEYLTFLRVFFLNMFAPLPEESSEYASHPAIFQALANFRELLPLQGGEFKKNEEAFKKIRQSLLTKDESGAYPLLDVLGIRPEKGETNEAVLTRLRAAYNDGTSGGRQTLEDTINRAIDGSFMPDAIISQLVSGDTEPQY